MFHQWVSQDEHVSCLVCGGTWEIGTDDEVTAANGDSPSRCSGDTGQGHGDPREQGDEPNDPRYRDDCNCLFCR